MILENLSLINKEKPKTIFVDILKKECNLVRYDSNSNQLFYDCFWFWFLSYN